MNTLARSLAMKLAALLEELERGLVERRRQVRLALLAALAGEHTLLVGPPGTAKSELARRLHRAFEDARYFERFGLTRAPVVDHGKVIGIVSYTDMVIKGMVQFDNSDH